MFKDFRMMVEVWNWQENECEEQITGFLARNGCFWNILKRCSRTVVARLRLSQPNSVPRSEEGEEVLASGMEGRPTADDFWYQGWDRSWSMEVSGSSILWWILWSGPQCGPKVLEFFHDFPTMNGHGPDLSLCFTMFHWDFSWNSARWKILWTSKMWRWRILWESRPLWLGASGLKPLWNSAVRRTSMGTLLHLRWTENERRKRRTERKSQGKLSLFEKLKRPFDNLIAANSRCSKCSNWPFLSLPIQSQLFEELWSKNSAVPQPLVGFSCLVSASMILYSKQILLSSRSFPFLTLDSFWS